MDTGAGVMMTREEGENRINSHKKPIQTRQAATHPQGLPAPLSLGVLSFRFAEQTTLCSFNPLSGPLAEFFPSRRQELRNSTIHHVRPGTMTDFFFSSKNPRFPRGNYSSIMGQLGEAAKHDMCLALDKAGH